MTETLVLPAEAVVLRPLGYATTDAPEKVCSEPDKTFNVVFEKKGRHGRQVIGLSPYLQSVPVEDADHRIGQIVPVAILSGQQNSLKGRRLGA